MKTTLNKNELVIFGNCKIAKSFFSRFIGLMGKKELDNDEAIIFPGCNSIHTFFMRMSIDVIFVSQDGRVVRILTALKPWRMLMPVSGSRHVVETAPGNCNRKGLKEGDLLNCHGVFG